MHGAARARPSLGQVQQPGRAATVWYIILYYIILYYIILYYIMIAKWAHLGNSAKSSKECLPGLRRRRAVCSTLPLVQVASLRLLLPPLWPLLPLLLLLLVLLLLLLLLSLLLLLLLLLPLLLLLQPPLSLLLLLHSNV